MFKYIHIEKARGKRLLPYVSHLFIPVSDILEFREFWDDIDNDKIGLQPCDEYDGVYISSLKYVKGERDYYRRLKTSKD